MKTLSLVSLFVIVSFGVTTCTASTDWTVLSKQLKELEISIRATMTLIKIIATQDNATIGEAISSKLDSAYSRVVTILTEASTAIYNKSLTKDQATIFVGKLKDIMVTLEENISPEFGELSESARNKIDAISTVEVETLETKAMEILILLQEEP